MQWLLVFAILIALMMGIAWVLTRLASGFSSAEPNWEPSEDTVRKVLKHDPSQVYLFGEWGWQQVGEKGW